MTIIESAELIAKLEYYNKNMRDGLKFQKLDEVIDSLYIRNLSSPKYSCECDYAYDILKKYLEDSGIDEALFKKTIPDIKEFQMSKIVSQYISLFPEETNSSNLSLKRKILPRGTLCFLSEPMFRDDFSRFFPIGLALENMTHLIYSDGDRILDTVSETDYQIGLPLIEEAFGTVCVFGANSGFIPYLLLKNENVKKVIIIEKNKRFYNSTRNIISYFPDSAKIEVVCSSYLKYIKKHADKIDVIFSDCWKSGDESIFIYVNFIKIEKKYKDIKFLYYFENGLIESVRANVLQYFSAKLSSDSYLNYFKSLFPELFNTLEMIPDVIKTEEQLDYYLSPKFVKLMLRQMRHAT